MSMQHRLSRFTHAIPGEHFAVIRPIRDDFRRMTVEAPRRSQRARARGRREHERAIKKVYIKQLKRDAHAGRPAKPGKVRKAPTTMKSRPVGSKGLIAGRHVAAHPVRTQTKKVGIQSHRPRIMNPHPPYLYHALPITRLGSIVRDKGVF